jgi:hypothetical protein
LEARPLRSTVRWNCRVSVLIVALGTTFGVMAPNLARADGPFDFFFNLFQPHSEPQSQLSSHPGPPAAGVGRIVPAPLGGQESVADTGGSTGHSVAFCVRLCDGQHFPIEQLVNGTPGETCRATCPYSKTKVFFGSEIGAAVAQDGQHYSALDTAFLYRKQLVANCTCNGKSALGLASFDVKRDPTLRPGDIISTKEGLLAYTGRSEQGAVFTPVNPAMLPVNIRPTSPQPGPVPSGEPMADDTGRVVPTQRPQPANQPSSR